MSKSNNLHLILILIRENLMKSVIVIHLYQRKKKRYVISVKMKQF